VHGVLDIATLAAALGGGLAAGVFAFSAFVMDALGRAEPPTGIEAMQWINRRAPTPAFLLAWLGTGVLRLAVAVWTALHGGDRRAVLAVAYAGGGVGLTFARNVPLNEALERMDARDARDRPLLAELRGPVDRVEPRPHGGIARRRGAPHRRPVLGEHPERRVEVVAAGGGDVALHHIGGGHPRTLAHARAGRQEPARAGL
jgi:uncharacterized membrane protein